MLIAAAILTLAAAAWFFFAPDTPPHTFTCEPSAQAIALITSPARRPTETITFDQGCLSAECHAAIHTSARQHPGIRTVECDVCHAPDAGNHTYPLLRSGEVVCTTCHTEQSAGLFTHQARSAEGCLACHDPHAGPTAALLRDADTPTTCARCHPPAEGTSLHPPYAAGRCEDCHNPHAADNSALLIPAAGDDHCRRCHPSAVHDIAAAPHAHKSIEGGCLACHAPHAGNHAALLLDKPRDLCASCHREVAGEVAAATVSHDPVLKGHQCISCHDAHASNNPMMLHARQPEACLECHDKAQRAADGRTIPEIKSALAAPVVHGAIRAGDCSACHAVHGGTHSRLLREINPTLLAGPYDERNFALCFSCHDRNLLAPDSATRFRDADRNLHAAHVKSDLNSHSCASCHSVHTSDLPRLMARTVRFEGSEWSMPINFSLTDTGGSCAPGCHEPMNYDRERASGGVP